MIVVIGRPVVHVRDGMPEPAGPAAAAALAAARAGAVVQLVGKIGDDEPGDDLVLALARGGVGHVALLRDPGRPTPRVVDRAATEDLDGDGDIPLPVPEPPDEARRPALDAADVELGLRYLTDFRVVVIPEPLSPAVVRAASDAATYAGARLIVLARSSGGEERPTDLPDDALVIEADDGASDVIARLVGEVAAAIDAGTPAAEAVAEATARMGAAPA